MIRDRIDAGERPQAARSAGRSALSHTDWELAEQLAGIAETGVVSRLPGAFGQERGQRTALAQRLFLTQADREPLLVLLGAVIDHNPETLKELPAERVI